MEGPTPRLAEEEAKAKKAADMARDKERKKAKVLCHF